jgi:hypothetical protein
MRSLLGAPTALAFAVLLIGCGDDDSFSPTVENVSGSYSAASFTLATGTGTIDLLALGADVTAVLEPDGTTTGHLSVPGGGEGGEDVEEDLTGAWTLSGTTVTFDMESDTFLRDVEFTAGENTLTGEFTDTDTGETVRLVMAKSD